MNYSLFRLLIIGVSQIRVAVSFRARNRPPHKPVSPEAVNVANTKFVLISLVRRHIVKVVAVGLLEIRNIGIGKTVVPTLTLQRIAVARFLIDDVANAPAAHVDKDEALESQFHLALATHELAHFFLISNSVG